MTTLTRYTLFQIPGWVIVAAVLYALTQWLGLSLWMVMGLFMLWVIKDFALYPFFRRSYESHVRTGSERLIGELGTTKEWLQPRGYVQIHGQLWQAVAEPKNEPIAPDTNVRVKGAEGLTLTVTSEKTGHNRTTDGDASSRA